MVSASSRWLRVTLDSALAWGGILLSKVGMPWAPLLLSIPRLQDSRARRFGQETLVEMWLRFLERLLVHVIDSISRQRHHHADSMIGASIPRVQDIQLIVYLLDWLAPSRDGLRPEPIQATYIRRVFSITKRRVYSASDCIRVGKELSWRSWSWQRSGYYV